MQFCITVVLRSAIPPSGNTSVCIHFRQEPIRLCHWSRFTLTSKAYLITRVLYLFYLFYLFYLIVKWDVNLNFKQCLRIRLRYDLIFLALSRLVCKYSARLEAVRQRVPLLSDCNPYTQQLRKTHALHLA